MDGTQPYSHTTWDEYCDRLQTLVAELTTQSCDAVLAACHERWPSGSIPCQYDGVYAHRGKHSRNMTGSIHVSRDGGPKLKVRAGASRVSQPAEFSAHALTASACRQGKVFARHHCTKVGEGQNFKGKTTRCAEAFALSMILAELSEKHPWFRPDPIRMVRR